jgi:hypothetical protein
VRDCDALLAVKTKFAQLKREDQDGPGGADPGEVDSLTFSEFVTMYGTQYMKQQEDKPFNPFKTEATEDRAAVIVGGRRYDNLDADPNADAESDRARRDDLGEGAAGSAQAPSESKLRRLFQTYDFDSDGRISMYDLKMALEVQHGRSFDIADARGDDHALLLQWIRQRDTTNTGYVNYDDFVRHYSTAPSRSVL